MDEIYAQREEFIEPTSINNLMSNGEFIVGKILFFVLRYVERCVLRLLRVVMRIKLVTI